jgi:hypothetical protein
MTCLYDRVVFSSNLYIGDAKISNYYKIITMKNKINLFTNTALIMAFILGLSLLQPILTKADEDATGTFSVSPSTNLAQDNSIIAPSPIITVQNVLPVADLGTINCSAGPFVSCLPSYFIVYLSNGTYENWNVTTWTSSPTYDGDINGTYTFTTTLTESANSAVTSSPNPPLTGSVNFIVTGATDPGNFSNNPSNNGNQDGSGSASSSSSTNPNQDGNGLFGSNPSNNQNQDNSGSDTTPPVISSVSDISTTTSGTSVIVNYTLPSATDAVDGSITPVCVPASGSLFSAGTTAVTCTATDNAGNSASTTFNVIVTQTTSQSTTTPTSTPAIQTINYGGGSSSSSSGSSINPLVSSATTTATTTIDSCPLLTSYLQFGPNNDASQVSKLQAFLQESQGLNVDINGIFDQQTLNAVKAFQQKYLSDIMGPWGATHPSGYVYITTEKKINELACNASLTFSPAELAIINAYKNQQGQNGSNNATGIAVPSNGAANSTTTPNASTTPLTPIIGQNGAGASTNVAAVGGFAPAWNNFWGSVWNHIVKAF